METMIELHDPERDCITGINGRVTAENQVVLTWNWPENETYNLCVVFEINGEDETLEELLRRKAKRSIYGSAFGIVHKADISDAYLQFRLYPARRENGTLFLVNQKKGNVSGVYVRKARIGWHVEYGAPGLFSQYRKARICLSGAEHAGEEPLYYRCTGGSNQRFLYAIDRSRFRENSVFEVTVEKNESIELVVLDGQEDSIELERI